MKTSFRRLFLLLLLAALAFLLACGDPGGFNSKLSDATKTSSKRQSLAAAQTLSGTVFGNGVVLPACKVEALTDGTTAAVAESTTNAAGAYALALEPATYDLRVTPPSGSEFSVHTVQDVIVGSSDAQRDIVLISSGTNVSGLVTGYGGAAVAGVSINVYSNGGGARLGVTSTDASGRYRLNLPDGIYLFQLSGGLSAVPTSWWLTRYDLTVAGSTVLDFALPVAAVTGHVTDSNTAPVPQVQIDVESSHATLSPHSQGANWNTVTTAADGSYRLLVLTGSSNFTIQPPASTTLPTHFRNGVEVSADTILDITLSPDTNVSGLVTGYGGAAVAGVSINVYSNGGGARLGVTSTDASGRYRLNLPDGIYLFQLSGGLSAVPTSWWLTRYDLTVAGSTVLDFALPVAEVTGRVTDSNTAPVPQVQIDVESSHATLSPHSQGANWNTVTTAADGSYRLLVLTGSSNFTIQPPSVSGFSTSFLTGVSVTGDLSQIVILEHPDLSPPIITAGPTVVHLSDTSVSINWNTNEPADSVVDFGIGTLNQSAQDTRFVTTHEVTLTGLSTATTYDYRVRSKDRSGNEPTQSPTLSFVTQPPPGDLTPPIIVAGPTVTFVDASRAMITWQTNEPADGVVSFGTTPTLGLEARSTPGAFSSLHAILLTGLSPSTTYHARVSSTDPDHNGPTASADFSFSTTAWPDTDPPVIIGSPLASSITDTSMVISWTTDEPATSGVSYRNGPHHGVVNDDGTFLKAHVITLAGLTPGTTYDIIVASKDIAGNGPTHGGPIQATTLSAPDTLPPAISDLAVIEMTPTTALVVWTTNEPSTSEVNYRLSSGSAQDQVADLTLTTEHRILLAGLLPGSGYDVTVTSKDASVNLSDPANISFQTVQLDGDGDGVPDATDNCPTTPNDQVDQDSDGRGDACDPCPNDAANDADGDGLCADRDACPTQHPGDVDSNGDGCPDGLSLLIGDGRLNEGKSGKSTMVFTVTLSAPSTADVTVAYATADGTATAGSDYLAKYDTLKFLAGTISKTISVPVKGDKMNEPDETFYVNLSEPVGASLGRAQGVGTIVNDDAAPPAIAIANATVTEGDRGTAKMDFVVTLSTAYGQTVKVSYSTHDGTGVAGATARADYAAKSATLTFSPGTTSKTISVQVKGDTQAESNETFTVVLSGPVNASIAQGTGVGTIANDD